MSSNFGEEGTLSYFDFNNCGGNDGEEGFTDLQSCELPNDTDLHSLDLDDDDEERQVTIHYGSLSKENNIKPNENLNKSKNQNEKVTPVDLPESSNAIRDLIREDLYKFVFMPLSKQFNNYISCRIRRNKSDLCETFRLEVEQEGDEKSFCLLTAEKQLKIIGQTPYTISVTSKFSNDCYSAELQSNTITGTSYVLYHVNGNERQQLAVILYETNFLGLSGPRKIKALLPKFNNQMETLIDENKIGDYHSKEQSDYFIHLHNKVPNWNADTGGYTLQFDGKDRVVVPSIKNFQMVIKNEDYVEQIVMQFGRMSENVFSCDFGYPLSLIQAFGIALSAFQTRLFRD